MQFLVKNWYRHDTHDDLLFSSDRLAFTLSTKIDNNDASWKSISDPKPLQGLVFRLTTLPLIGFWR